MLSVYTEFSAASDFIPKYNSAQAVYPIALY